MLTQMAYVGNFQSVDNEIVLWEPKMKEQSPGEVRIHCSVSLVDTTFLHIIVSVIDLSNGFDCL